MSPSQSPSTPAITSTTLLTKISTLLSTDRPNLAIPNTYDAPILPIIHLHSASLTPSPILITHLTIPPSLCSSLGVLHGGATATIFDIVTTLAVWLVADPESGAWMMPGVSRQLDIVYLDAVRSGKEVEVSGEVVRVGRRLVQLRGVMRRRGGNGRVLATCEHGKVNVDGGKI